MSYLFPLLGTHSKFSVVLKMEHQVQNNLIFSLSGSTRKREGTKKKIVGTGEGGQVSSAPPEELEPTLPEISLSPQAHKGGQNCSHFCGYWTTLVTPKYCGILEKRCSSSLLFFFYIIPEKVIDNHLLKGTFIRCQTFPCLFFHCCQLTAGAALTWEWDHHNIKVPYSSYRL